MFLRSCLWTLVALAAWAQEPCPVEGTVRNKATGQPIARAHVLVRASKDSRVTSITDANGRWQIASAECGRVHITAERVGFLSGEAQQEQVLRAGTPVADIEIRLEPLAVISGRVLDEFGDPMWGATVLLARSRIMDGLRHWQTLTTATTNDLGEYRLAGFEAGEYFVCATASSNAAALLPPAVVYAMSCNPAMPELRGTIAGLRLPPASDTKVDLSIPRSSGVVVRGRVTGVGAKQNVNVQLLPIGNQITLDSYYRIDYKDGQFTATGVRPGSYLLTANVFDPQGRLTAELPVNIGNSDVGSIELQLTPGLTLKGKVSLGALPSRAAADSNVDFFLRPERILSGLTPTSWSTDRLTFSTSNLNPGRYRIVTRATHPFYVKSILLGGAALTDLVLTGDIGPIELVLANDGGSLTGLVTNTEGVPVAGVLALAAGSEPPRISYSNDAGIFTFTGVPPGDYKLYAWDDQKAEYGNPDWMRTSAGDGVPVHVLPNQTSRVSVRQILLP